MAPARDAATGRSVIACPLPGQAICSSWRIERGFFGIAGLKSAE